MRSVHFQAYRKYGGGCNRFPCTTMTDHPIPDWYIRSNATSRPGSFQKTTKSQKLWKKPTRDFTEKKIGTPETAKMRKARPLTDKWTFSTNGVSIMGRNGIPCIGFGPGAEAQAHAPNEKTWKADLVVCAAVYAALPTLYCK